MDPESQTFKVIRSVGDVESCCWRDMSACYWKDSKVIVFGGYDGFRIERKSSMAIITLENLDSENPSAHWKTVDTPTPLATLRTANIIYKGKMYAFGGKDQNDKEEDAIWYLDLKKFTWTQCFFEGHTPDKAFFELVCNYIFHGSKVYAIKRHYTGDLKPIIEFDLETMSCKMHTIPTRPIDTLPQVEPFPQVIDGKIYFIENLPNASQELSPIRHVLGFDLDSSSWTEIKTESFPPHTKIGLTLQCNKYCLFCPRSDNGSSVFGEFWSLPLSSSSKPSKTSSTSENITKTQQALKEFFFEAPYSDISFEVESEIIKAHKWWLIQKNKFFANMFASGMAESQAAKISITDMKPSTFKALLEFLYSDHVEINDAIALELLQQADKYSIGELKSACEKHLIANIEPENYVALGQIAELIGAVTLREALVTFIGKNMKALKQRKDFNDISDALLRDSLVKFIVK